MLKLFFSFSILFTSDFLRLSAKTEVAPGKDEGRKNKSNKNGSQRKSKNYCVVVVANAFLKTKNKAKVEIVILDFYLV